MASSVGGVEDFIIKHGEVEREAQSDGVGGLHLGLGDIVRLLVGLSAVFGHGCDIICLETLNNALKIIAKRVYN